MAVEAGERVRGNACCGGGQARSDHGADSMSISLRGSLASEGPGACDGHRQPGPRSGCSACPQVGGTFDRRVRWPHHGTMWAHHPISIAQAVHYAGSKSGSMDQPRDDASPSCAAIDFTLSDSREQETHEWISELRSCAWQSLSLSRLSSRSRARTEHPNTLRRSRLRNSARGSARFNRDAECSMTPSTRVVRPARGFRSSSAAARPWRNT